MIFHIEHTPLAQGMHATEIHRDMDKQIFGRQRDYRGTDRIASGIQNRVAEKLWIGECKTQRDARAAGETGNVNSLGIDTVMADDVLFGKYGERFAASKNVLVISGIGRPDIYNAMFVQNGPPKPSGSSAALSGGTKTTRT